MTTFLNNLNEQLFTELTAAEAAVIQGGWDFVGYDGSDGQKVIAKANFALPELKYNNKMSSFDVNGGTWRLFTGPNYTGDYFDARPGKYTLLGTKWNNKISSLKQIA
jgi:hypothetical protein